MYKSALILLILISSVQGCSMLHLDHAKKDIPPRPIIEEQDTPFVFQQAYQTEGLYATQVYLENQNDFVEIASSIQYVWWTPFATENVFTVVKPTDSESTTINNGDSPAMVKNMPATPLIMNEMQNACAMIYCDGHKETCGAIQTCNGKVCDEKKRNEYSCMNESCSQVKAKTIIEVAKGEIKCSKYPERYICPQSTACKLKPTKNEKVSLKVARKLFAGEK